MKLLMSVLILSVILNAYLLLAPIDLSPLLSADFLKFFLPLAGVAVAWIVNQWRLRQADAFARREERYQKLLLSLQGFYTGAEDVNRKRDFIDQLALSWLYCPDVVIQRANAFAQTIKPKTHASMEDKTKALGLLVGAIRKDLLSRSVVRRTSLTGLEYERLTAIIEPNTPSQLIAAEPDSG